MTRMDKALIAYPLVGGLGIMLWEIGSQILPNFNKMGVAALATGLGAGHLGCGRRSRRLRL